jgi:hypothetical protein
MLELIDQSQPTVLKYRCSACHVVGVSSPVMANPENAFWIATPGGQTPGKWAIHVCQPADIAKAQAYLTAQAHAAAAEIAGTKAPGRKPHAAKVPAVAGEPPKKRGRPKKQAAPTGT